LIKSWKNAAHVPFDLGLLDDGAECTRFAECVGWGVFARTIAEAKQRDADGEASVRQTLKRDRRLFRQIARKLESRSYHVEIDGRDCSGDYVLVEIMNVGLLGPQLPLSPSSDSSDGKFEVVLVSDRERDALERVARSGEPEPDGYRTERGRHVRIRADDALLHRDGKLVRHALGTRGFEVRVEPAAVHYLR
jgi:diacylglycerol kinase family enzyme